MGATSIKVQVNGESRELPEGSSIAELVEQLGLRPQVVAVERNRALVPRAQHAQTQLEAGDELEVVTLVGGG